METLRILSDCPDELTGFVGPEGSWGAGSLRQLAGADRALWEALGGGPDVWSLEFRGARPEGFWSRALVFAEATASRFDALHAALREGLALPGPLAVIALSGSGFRGQRERSWAAAPGNLFLSVALAPDAPIRQVIPGLTMLPAVATVDAIRGLPGRGIRPDIKWVNDVLVEGRKVGGVLTATHVRGGRVESVVLGIGVNVATAPEIAPTPFVPLAGCLREFGARIERGALVWRVLERLALRYQSLVRQGGQELLGSYREAAVVLGRSVRVWAEGVEKLGRPRDWPAPQAAGVVRAIGPDLALHLEGCDEPVRSGRLALDSACGAFGL